MDGQTLAMKMNNTKTLVAKYTEGLFIAHTTCKLHCCSPPLMHLGTQAHISQPTEHCWSPERRAFWAENGGVSCGELGLCISQ